MRASRPILATSHRLARLVTWLKLWLAWAVVAFGAWMAAGERHQRRSLDKIARFACHIALYSACARVYPCWRRAKHRHGRLQRLTRRIAIGARLRQSVRGRDFASRLHAILCFVRDLEAHIAHAAQRLRAGFTRLRVLTLTPQRTPALTRTPACAVGGVDTS